MVNKLIPTPRGDGRAMVDLSSTVNSGYPSAAPGTGADWFGPLAPMQPVAPKEVAGRAWDFPVGYNLHTMPRPFEGVPFAALRRLADSFEPVRLIIERRKDQACRANWTVKPRHEGTGRRQSQISDAMRSRISDVKAMLERPSYGVTFRKLLRQLVEDLLVIDAPALFLRRDQRGRLIGYHNVDGSLIKPVLSDSGCMPEPIAIDGRLSFAWNGQTITADTPGWQFLNGLAWPPIAQQILKGMPAANLTALQLLYAPLNVRPGTAYGYSPVEQMMMTIATATRRAVSTLEYFTDGNQPDAIFSLPDGFSPDQATRFQEYWDSLYSGNTANRRRMKFVVGGKYQALKDPVLKAELDEWLIRICCFAFAYPPSAFVSLSNRSIADAHEKQSEEEGLGSIKQWASDVFNEIISVHIGYDDIVFDWLEEEEVDSEKQATILSTYTGSGIMTANEAREALGLAPSTAPGADELMIKTATGAIPLGSAPDDESDIDDPNDDNAAKLQKRLAKITMTAPSAWKPCAKFSLAGVTYFPNPTTRELRVASETDVLALEGAGWSRKIN